MTEQGEVMPKELNARRERRRKRQRELSSQTDDDKEAHDSDQNGDAENEAFLPSQWQEEITEKLNMLLNILPLVEGLKEELTTLKEENAKLRKLFETTSDEVKSLKASQQKLATDLLNNKELLDKANQDLEVQKRRNIKLEAQSRRSNIKFFNVPETEANENPKETESVLKRLLRKELKMSHDAVNHLEFERVHRIPTRRNADQSHEASSKPRPIIAKLSFFKDKAVIFRHAKNIDPNLKIGVADDFPKEIEDMRKELRHVLKKAKQQKKRASFNVDRLIIDGQVYRGIETKNLPFYANIMAT